MPQTILLTGATGYVGGRLLPRLTSMEHSVRCLVRDAGRLEGRPGAERAEIVEGDVLDFSTLTDAFHGVSTVYYLIHSMGSAGGFEDADRQAAEHVAKAACQAGVRRIVYLGGLGGDDADSPHLRSRHEVGRVLAASGVPTIELRASIVIGPGSLSFDLVRSLVERLPVMITPRWVRSMAQPIHIEDVLRYLEAGLTLEESHIVEIGGMAVIAFLAAVQLIGRGVPGHRIDLTDPCFLIGQLHALGTLDGDIGGGEKRHDAFGQFFLQRGERNVIVMGPDIVFLVPLGTIKVPDAFHVFNMGHVVRLFLCSRTKRSIANQPAQPETKIRGRARRVQRRLENPTTF